MLTLETALQHLGYDEVDAVIRAKVTDQLAEAETLLKGAVGDDIFELLPDDPRINTLLKAYLDDLHDDRGTVSAKASNAKRALIHTTEWQLKTTLIRKREGASV